MLVEDDSFYAELLTNFLKDNGFQDIRHASSGVDCMLQVFEERSPDVVIMDYKLGQLDGISIMEKLLLHKPDMKIIFISNQIDLHVAVNAMKLGAEDYLRKNDELFSKLISRLNRITIPQKENSLGSKIKKILCETREFYNETFLGIPKTIGSKN